MVLSDMSEDNSKDDQMSASTESVLDASTESVLDADTESLLETVSDAEVDSRISFEEFTDERELLA